MLHLEKHSPPQRLSEERGQTGFRTGLSHSGMFWFGLPFFLIGQYFVLGVLGLRPLDMEKSNAPPWILGLVGLVFLMGGLMLWGMGYRRMRFHWEVTGRGKNRSKRIVHECGWSGGRTFDEGSDFARSGLLEAEFVIPPEAPATKIDAERPVFWELRVRLETPGPDFHQRYLVPLY